MSIIAHIDKGTSIRSHTSLLSISLLYTTYLLNKNINRNWRIKLIVIILTIFSHLLNEIICISLHATNNNINMIINLVNLFSILRAYGKLWEIFFLGHEHNTSLVLNCHDRTWVINCLYSIFYLINSSVLIKNICSLVKSVAHYKYRNFIIYFKEFYFYFLIIFTGHGQALNPINNDRYSITSWIETSSCSHC